VRISPHSALCEDPHTTTPGESPPDTARLNRKWEYGHPCAGFRQQWARDFTLTAYTGTPSHDGLKLPASLTGLGPRTGQASLVAAWYAGLTPLALAFAYRGRGLGRQPGTVIITGYLAFISALATTITQARVSPAAAAVPAAVITLTGTILARPPEPARCPAAAGRAAWWQRRSLLPGWNAGRLWTLSLALCLIIAACDAATRPRLILIGLLICGPCSALLTARWAPTAASGAFALALGVALGVPDQRFATFVQYTFLSAITAVTATATAGAAVLQRRSP
jgi:hypothetical protein